jgi:hypothetical protein
MLELPDAERIEFGSPAQLAASMHGRTSQIDHSVAMT